MTILFSVSRFKTHFGNKSINYWSSFGLPAFVACFLLVLWRSLGLVPGSRNSMILATTHSEDAPPHPSLYNSIIRRVIISTLGTHWLVVISLRCLLSFWFLMKQRWGRLAGLQLLGTVTRLILQGSWRDLGFLNLVRCVHFLKKLVVHDACPYCGHFQPHGQIGPLDWDGTCLMWLEFVNHEDFRFKFQNCKSKSYERSNWRF